MDELRYQISDLRKSVTFSILDKLAISLIVGTAYQQKLIQPIQCKGHRLKPIAFRSVAMLDTFDSPMST